jgi:hypothetical protein
MGGGRTKEGNKKKEGNKILSLPSLLSYLPSFLPSLFLLFLPSSTCMLILQGKRRRHWAQFFALAALHEKNHGQYNRGETGGQAGLGERSKVTFVVVCLWDEMLSFLIKSIFRK